MARFSSGLAKLFQKFVDSGESFDNCRLSDSEDDDEQQADQSETNCATRSQIRRRCTSRKPILTFRQLFGAPLLVRQGPNGLYFIDTLKFTRKRTYANSTVAFTQTPPHPKLSFSGRLSICASANPTNPLPRISHPSEYPCLLSDSAASIKVSVSCQVSPKRNRSRNRNRRRGGNKRQKITNVFGNILAALILSVEQNIRLNDEQSC